jgi:hypothetical protein
MPAIQFVIFTLLLITKILKLVDLDFNCINILSGLF